ncbi:hypothetical protein PGB90_001707 [Kerria lacca]
MCALAEPASKCEQRPVVRFPLLEKQTPAATAKRLKEIYGDKALSCVHIWKWCKQFQEGRTNLHNENRSGCPSIITEELVNSVQEHILNGHRLTISDLYNLYPDLSIGTMFDIVRSCLQYRKICARWVPKELSSAHMELRFEASLDFFARNNEKGNDLMNRIVTCDETWIHYNNPESKRESMQWKHTTSSCVQKFKQTLSVKKMMASVFWDCCGMLLFDFLPYGTIINTELYCDQLRRLRMAIKNRRRNLLTRGVMFFQDNARSHTSRVTTELLKSFKWDVFPHPSFF